MTRSTLLGSLRISRYNPGELSGDGRGGERERGYRKGWNDAIGFVERELIGYPATSSAPPNELTHAEGVAPFSSPSLGALSPSPSSSANSHGDTFSAERWEAVGQYEARCIVCGFIAFVGADATIEEHERTCLARTNRLGRACTDCGAGDGESHREGCAWTEVVR